MFGKKKGFIEESVPQKGKFELFAIKDEALGRFGNVVMDVNSDRAASAFAKQMEKNENPQDYSLYFLGTFNDDTGVIDAEKPVLISDYEIWKGNRKKK